MSVWSASIGLFWAIPPSRCTRKKRKYLKIPQDENVFVKNAADTAKKWVNVPRKRGLSFRRTWFSVNFSIHNSSRRVSPIVLMKFQISTVIEMPRMFSRHGWCLWSYSLVKLFEGSELKIFGICQEKISSSHMRWYRTMHTEQPQGHKYRLGYQELTVHGRVCAVARRRETPGQGQD